jgi:hypothetical protein
VFRNYALKHGTSWYRFVQETLCHDIQGGSLYLVTGCDMTESWAVASFSNSFDEDGISLKFKAVQDASPIASSEFQWETFSSVSVRVGPKHIPGESKYKNQCIFLRGFRVSMRDASIKGVSTYRTPDESRYASIEDAEMTLEHFPEVKEVGKFLHSFLGMHLTR